MSYNITLTNGTTLTKVNDGTINQTVTDLTLIGKNSTGYGGFFNDNFVRLLENFSNSSQPNYPLTGQLWYDTSENRLKIYNGSAFTTTSGTIVSATVPSNIGVGDIWIDNVLGQMHFNDGLNTVLAGPIYNSNQGITGFNVEDVIDTAGRTQTILVLYVARTILGIFSKTTFTPALPIPGFTNTSQFIGSQFGNVLTVTSIAVGSLSVGQVVAANGIATGTIITGQLSGTTGGPGTYSLSLSGTVLSTTMTASANVVKIGFNTGTFPGVVFDAIASRTQSLVAADGSLKTADDFVSASADSTSNGQLSIRNNIPLILGAGSNVQFKIDTNSNTFQMNSNTADLNFGINLQTNGALQPSLFIAGSSQFVGLGTQIPTAKLDVNGDTVIRGNLTVQGTTQTISSTTVTIADKNLELGKVTNPTNTTAESGGITLKGTTDKTMIWSVSATSTGSNTGYWNFSDFVNISSSGANVGYYINGNSVLSATTLGSGITGAPGLTSIGALTSLQAAFINITGSTISYVNSSSTNGNITLTPKGSGYISVSSSLISNVGTPVSGTDATNKTYVDDRVKSAPLGLYVDFAALGISLGSANASIINFLTKVYPPAITTSTTTCRVLCSDGTVREFTSSGSAWLYTQVIT